MNTTASSACFCDPTRNEDDSADTDSESSPWNASDYQQYVEYDDELWGGFPEASLVSVLFGSVLLVGLTGNGIVVYVVVRSWAMRTVTNLYFLNLAIADLLVLVFCAPFTASVYLLPTWPFGAVACKLVNYVMIVSTAVSVMTLMVMGLDRYQAVVSPVQSRANRTLQKTLTVIAAIWSLNLVTSIPALFVSRLQEFYDFGGAREYCINYFSRSLYRKMFTLTVFLMFYCLPLLFIGGCYFLMARNLRGHAKPGDQPQSTRTNDGTRTRQQNLKPRKRLSKLVLAVVVTFAVCWLPIHCVHLKTDFSTPTFSFTLYVVKIVAHFFSYANSAINPCLYAFMSGNFRQCLKDAFRCFHDDRQGDGEDGARPEMHELPSWGSPLYSASGKHGNQVTVRIAASTASTSGDMEKSSAAQATQSTSTGTEAMDSPDESGMLLSGSEACGDFGEEHPGCVSESTSVVSVSASVVPV